MAETFLTNQTQSVLTVISSFIDYSNVTNSRCCAFKHEWQKLLNFFNYRLTVFKHLRYYHTASPPFSHTYHLQVTQVPQLANSSGMFTNVPRVNSFHKMTIIPSFSQPKYQFRQAMQVLSTFRKTNLLVISSQVLLVLFIESILCKTRA